MLPIPGQVTAQRTAAAAAASRTLVRPAPPLLHPRPPPQQQQQQQQQQPDVAAPAAATQRQHPLQARPPLHGKAAAAQDEPVQQLTALLRACDSTAQLEGVLRGHLPHMPPACAAAAMQRLQAVRHVSAAADDHQVLQMAGQLTAVLLRQFPLVPAGCLGAFLAAAAGMRLVVPPAVLQQLATHLVHVALRQACHERQQQQHQDEQQQQQQQRHVLAVAVWALAKLRLRDAALWEELGSLAGEQVAALAPHDCVLLAWGFAKAGHHPPRLLHALQSQLRPQVWCLSPDQLACLLWSYATAQHYHHGWVSALAGGAADSMERFSARSLATALWACARMRHADGRMLSAARVQALACIGECGPQGTANLAWALASLGVVDEALTAAVLGRATQLVHALTLQGLSNTAWAVTRLSTQQAAGSWGSGSSRGALQRQAAAFLTAACSAAVPLLHTAKPQEVCNLLWACATLKQSHPSFLAAAAGRLAVLADAASPVDLAQAVWALEVLRFRRKAVQQGLLRSALNKLHNFGPQALSNVAWAVASSGMRPPPGFAAAVAQQLQLLLPQMTPQGVATTLWALSKLGAVPRQLVHAASAYVLASLHQYRPHDLCNLAMVASKAGYREPALLHGLARAACSAAAAAASMAAHDSLAPWQAQQQEEQEQQSWWYAGPTSSQPAVPGPAGGLGQHVKLLTSQGVCNLVWAFAGLGWHDASLLQQLQAVAVSQLGTMQPRHVAGLCQGFGLLLEPFEGLLAALYASGSSRQQQQQLEAGGQHREAGGDADSPGLLLQHMQVWAHALRTWPADSLALLVPAVAVTQGARCSSRDAALLLTALQLLSRDGMAASLSPARQQQLHHALTLLAVQWGLADAGHAGKHSVSSPSTCGAQPSPMHELGGSTMLPGALGCSSRHLQQPHADESSSPGRGQLVALAGAALHHKLVRACAGSWLEAERSRQPSHVEGEVVAALQQLGTQPLTQHWLQLAPALSRGLPASAFSGRSGSPVQPWRAMLVRVGLPGGGPGSAPVALEVLPRAALSSSAPRRPLGVTALQHACLAATGWRVVCIAAEEWEALGSHQQRQAELLRARLRLAS